MKYTILTPEQAGSIGSHFLAQQPPKVRQWILAYLPEAEQGQALDKTLAQVAHICAVHIDGQFAALGWLYPVCPHASTACGHFIMPPLAKNLQLEIGRIFVSEALARYEALMTLVPRQLRAVRQLLAVLGFDHAVTLPKSCFIQARSRCVDGCFYIIKRGDYALFH